MDSKKFILKGIAYSLITTMIMLLVFALLLTYTNIQENTIESVLTVIVIISSIIGSFFATIKIKRNGIWNGLLIGLTYVALIYLISGICGGGMGLTVYSWALIVTTAITGMLGGIIGVNF
ncbi:MAG: TIGR04086 family membrane protein [Clostridia bacterium]|nr:TIGR04086 family membrane protein [Clostridia bacterium]